MSFADDFDASKVSPLTLGWVSYWNLLPLRHELQRLYGEQLITQRGTPEQVNRWLSEGKVVAAPSSSVCLVRNERHEIAWALGIASHGAVSSVYFGLHHEELFLLEFIKERQQQLKELLRQGFAKFGSDTRKVAGFLWKGASLLAPIDPTIPPPLLFTPASATSAALGRILYRLWFGEAAFELRANPNYLSSLGFSTRRPMELLIGDEALIRKPQFRAILDLGEIWKDLTDLPFVFAIWQTAGQTIPAPWRQRMFEASELAQARMHVEPCHYLPDIPAKDINGHSIDLGQYWKHIHYRLGPSHFKSLALFLSLVRLMNPDQYADTTITNIMRWEGFAESNQSVSNH